MSDVQKMQEAQERAVIVLEQPQEVRYWTDEFGISEAELRALVARVGPCARDVRVALGRPIHEGHQG
ncbi:DUF3606 domain-containing protein [Pseudoduganella sp. UC29_71]|jgi:hypothetical protein|uniref:DUF3606 domain-containing protein n=1 Tax=Pseudoduganella sp. UC29_71 TaxID=3350174 RepID=UPI003672BDD6